MKSFLHPRLQTKERIKNTIIDQSRSLKSALDKMKKFDIFKKVSIVLALVVVVVGVLVACQQESGKQEEIQEEETLTYSVADIAATIILAAVSKGEDVIVTVNTDGTVQCKPASGVQAARLKSDTPESTNHWAVYGSFCGRLELMGALRSLHSGNNGACYVVKVESGSGNCVTLSHKLC